MHDDEVATGSDLVRRLIAAQFPKWAELPISPVSSSGTCNALYRLGKDKVVRLPLAGWADGIAFDFAGSRCCRSFFPAQSRSLSAEGGRRPNTSFSGVSTAGSRARTPVWIHSDLMPGNLLLQGGKLSAVTDWDGSGLGDPAWDLIVAWNLLTASARGVYRDALRVDSGTWDRGRGWALSIALIALPHYKDTNPEFAANARHAIREVLAVVSASSTAPVSA